MASSIIYLDNHSTTRVDPRVVEAMIPVFDTDYGNSGSVTHEFGMDAHDLVHTSGSAIAEFINAAVDEIVFTSGATESNNLAIRGICHPNSKRRHIITVQTEHKAVLDPLERLGVELNFDVTQLPVGEWGTADAGLISIEDLESAISDQTALVSIMMGNNEIGTIQPIQKIAEICHRHGAVFHCDATQAVGKLPVDVDALGIDLMSFSAHKAYGPKGVGALFVRKRDRRIKLRSQIDGGGQQSGRRSGTLNVPGIVGMATALKLCAEELCGQSVTQDDSAGKISVTGGDIKTAQQIDNLLEPDRIGRLRDLLYQRLTEELGELPINGQPLDQHQTRLYCNLNCQFPGINAHSLMTMVDTVAVSTGSACTASAPQPSHVLRSLGLIDDQIHSSLRFGIGRFNTESEIIESANLIVAAVKKLREMA
jgi:cysteine desulfurase